jgi:hypothetical protein
LIDKQLRKTRLEKDGFFINALRKPPESLPDISPQLTGHLI